MGPLVSAIAHAGWGRANVGGAGKQAGVRLSSTEKAGRVRVGRGSSQRLRAVVRGV